MMIYITLSVLAFIYLAAIVHFGGLLFGLKRRLALVPSVIVLLLSTAVYIETILENDGIIGKPPLVPDIILSVWYLFCTAITMSAVYKKLSIGFICYNFITMSLSDFFLAPFRVVLKNVRIADIAEFFLQILVFSLLIIVIKKKKHESLVQQSVASVDKKIYVLLMLFILCMAITNIHMTRKATGIYIVAWLLALVFALVLMIYCVMTAVSERNKQKSVDLLSERLDSQLHYYEKINDIYGEFRSFRHDYKNHMLCVESLLKKGETEQALEYMRTMEGITKERTNKFSTGNVIVDALLDDKQDRADLSNTTIEFSGRMPSEGITNIDLCTVVANAVDNAIEACEKGDTHEHKSIQITSAVDKGCFFFKISNPMYDTVKIKDGNKVTTSKEDSTRHGFGVANIVSTAEKYSGSAELSAADGVFTLEADLVLGSA